MTKVFFDIAVGGWETGRTVFQLRNDLVPKTAENFKQLCTGENGFGYKGTPFHRVVPRGILQRGDFTKHNGTGGKSIYGNTFADENFELKHSKLGVLSMKNTGPDTNGSQFFITMGPSSWLDGKNVAFGEVVDGWDILEKIERCGSNLGRLSKTIVITDSGIL